MMDYFVHENIFAVDKVRNDIAASVHPPLLITGTPTVIHM
jgi:hypothetical protein